METQGRGIAYHTTIIKHQQDGGDDGFIFSCETGTA